jgi:NADH-quinone oxidoreductase subunit M
MAIFIGLLFGGQALVDWEGSSALHSTAAILILAAAVLIRCGVAPLHCWMTDLFERASFGTALLFVTPMVGAYGAMRLVLPIAPDWVLQMISVASIFTALYAAGMALVQTDVRRFFAYIFLSHSSLVLAGLESATSSGLTGALCVWLSVGLAMVGFGLTLRAIESRTGSLSLREFHGLYEQTPMLAVFFLLTGLAAIGFPGTIGFVALEILVEGAVDVTSLAGVAIVVATALNGLAVLWAYFRIFTGTRHQTSVDLSIRPAERFAVLVLTLLILGGGLLPQPGVASRHHAAMHLVSSRTKSGLHINEIGSDDEHEDEDDSDDADDDDDRDLRNDNDREDATDNQSIDSD